MILVVDDDDGVRASLALLFKQEGFPCHTAGSPAEALAALRQEPCELVLQDLNFSRQTGGEEGLELLGRIRAEHPALPVVLITAWGSIELAVRGMRGGAQDFLTKPWDPQRLLQTVRTVLDLSALRATPHGTPSRETFDPGGTFDPVVGRHPALLAVLQLAARVAPTDASVLVTGESGTGKDLLAGAIHDASVRRRGPLVKVNLGGIATSLFESEMFGHVRGAFTDARSDRRGRFDLAHGGTIFLDEIGDLPLECQVKLLRVLQDRTYEVLGESAPRRVDVRVISATNRDLPGLVGAGRFREDLLYRINLIHLHLPPLRERASDIPEVAATLLAGAAATYGRPAALSADAMTWLGRQPWPGNVRQLRQVLERALIVTDGPTLHASLLEHLSAAPGGTPAADPAASGVVTLDAMERAAIERSLAHHGGNISRVAEALGLSRAALYRRLEKHGLKP